VQLDERHTGVQCELADELGGCAANDEAVSGRRFAAGRGGQDGCRLTRVAAADMHGLGGGAGEVVEPSGVHEATVVDDDDRVRDVLHLGEQVAGHQHGPALLRVPAQDISQPADPLGVEPIGGLVADQHGWVGEQRRGQSEALTHAEGIAAHPPPGGVSQPDQVEDLVNAGVVYVGCGRVDP
jgi:hypothetical protein